MPFCGVRSFARSPSGRDDEGAIREPPSCPCPRIIVKQGRIAPTSSRCQGRPRISGREISLSQIDSRFGKGSAQGLFPRGPAPKFHGDDPTRRRRSIRLSRFGIRRRGSGTKDRRAGGAELHHASAYAMAWSSSRPRQGGLGLIRVSLARGRTLRQSGSSERRSGRGMAHGNARSAGTMFESRRGE